MNTDGLIAGPGRVMSAFVLGFVFDIILQRFIDRTGERLSEPANDDDRVRGAYGDAWTVGKTSGRSAHLLAEQLTRWNVPPDLASETSVLGSSLREWFVEGIPPRTVKRLLKDLEARDSE